MKEQELIAYIKNMHRSGPRPEWFAATRKELLVRVERMVSADRTGLLWWQHIQSSLASARNILAQLAQHRVLVGSALVALLMLLGSVSFAISRNALPSSTLYPLKLVAESAVGSLAFTVQSQAEHTLDLAEHRFRELSQLSRATSAHNASRPQPDLIANTARRYAAALSTSTETLKRLQAEGNTVLAVRTAEKLEKTANAYTTLLSLLDTASSSSLTAFEDAKEISEEASRAAQEVLASSIFVSSSIPVSSSSPIPQVSEAPMAIPSVMPNIVEP